MRIVHLTNSTVSEITGGLEYHIAYLCKALEEQGHEITIVNTAAVPGLSRGESRAEALGPASPKSGALRNESPAGALRQNLDAVGETLAMFTLRLLKSRHAATIARYVESLNPDIIHQHSYLDGLGVSLLLKTKYPVVFTNHTGAYIHLDRFAVTRKLQRQLMKRFSAVIGPSRELLPDTENSHYVSNGVDTDKFFPCSAEDLARLRTKYSCTGKRVFLCPRRWAPTKGVIYLADALRRVNQATRENSVFIFAGGETPGYSRYQENVRQSLAASGCEVRVLGNLGHDQLAELMSLADACIIPSLMEATSLACLEAMACGTPVLGTRTGGLLELIHHGENGWLAPTADAGALTALLDQICAIDDLTSLREAAVATVRKSHTWRIAAESTEKIYQEALYKASQETEHRRREEKRLPGHADPQHSSSLR